MGNLHNSRNRATPPYAKLPKLPSRILAICLTLILAMTTSACSLIPKKITADSETILPLDHPMRQSVYFPVASPESQGMDSKILTAMFEKIKNENINIHHIQVLRHGKLVAASQMYPYQANELHVVNGIASSITSTAIGRLITTQKLVSTKTKVGATFLKRSYSYDSQYKQEMTWQDVLTMTTGMAWIESGRDNDANSNNVVMKQSPDAVQYVLDQPVLNQPGQTFSYNTGTGMLLSGLVEHLTKKRLLSFTETNIFKPLEISRYFWEKSSNGQTIGGEGLYMTPGDLLKIGYLYAHGGKWSGKTLLSPEWIGEATRKHVETPDAKLGKNGFGYQWWLNEFSGFSARGSRGQYLFVIPEEDLVVVFLSDLGADQLALPEDLMKDYILPSIQSPYPLHESSKWLKRLQEAMQALNEPPAIVNLPPIKPQGLSHSGKLYQNDAAPDEMLGLEFVEGKDYATFQWMTRGESFKAYVGLDNQYRVTRIPNFLKKGLVTPVAMRGSWRNDAIFEIEMVPLQSAQRMTMILTFTDNSMSGAIRLGQ